MKKKKNRKAAVKKADRQSKAKLILALAVPATLIALVIIMGLPEESIDFNFTENMGMWQVSEGSTFRQVKDSVQLIRGKSQLYVVVPQMNIDAEYYDVCVIEGSWPIAYDQGHLLFISRFNRQFDYNFRYDYDTGKSGRMNRRYIDLGGHGAWQGSIPAVLILPATDADQVSLKRISFIHANPWTRIKAWWSAFTRYQDPLLGTCFAMATPIFMGKPFNPYFAPVLWVLIIICGMVVGGVHLFQADQRISKITLAVLCIALFLAWGVLDLRNNVYYLKAISRNISLYWGRSILESRGIVVGDPGFIYFMKFCDENIPINAKVYNQVPVDVPGTPPNYLAGVQYWANIRPRFSDGGSESYYIFYKPKNKNNWELYQEQTSINEYLDILPGEKLQQEIKLWQPSDDLYQINLWLRGNDIDNAKVDLLLLSQDKTKIAGKFTYVSRTAKETIFRFMPNINFYKDTKMVLQIENKGNVPIAIGSFVHDIYREGDMFLAGKRLFGDLAFRFIYRPRDLVLFKRFNDEAYILMDRETE